jgi:hypothetical protein
VLRRWPLLLLLPLALPAEDHWLDMKSGPFHVFTNGDDRKAREDIMYLEQFREALRVILGKEDLQLNWPVRVLVFKNAKQIPPSPAEPALGRDALMFGLREGEPIPVAARKGLARLLIEANTKRLPQAVDEGLIELVSTLEVSGVHITLGDPVPSAERSRDWARMHLLTVNPSYFGRTRVFVNNLEQSGDMAAAYRNAYQKSAPEIEKQLDAYIQAGIYGTAQVPGRALSLQRDFQPLKLDSDAAAIALADLTLAAGSKQAEAAYAALHGAQSAEGLGLVALREHKTEEAKRLLASAIESGSTSARAWMELGILESDPAKARKDLQKAAELNPRLAEPHFRLAQREEDPARKAILLKKAATLEPRNIDYWEALARAYIAAKDFVNAGKAWGGAESAAANEEERDRIHQVRLQVQQERFDFEEAERKRMAAERQADIDRVKAASDAEIHAAEAAANKKMNPEGAPVPKATDWASMYEGNAKAAGLLQRFDCMGKQGRLVIQTADGKVVQLLVRDPSQLYLSGEGEITLDCGPQKNPRKVVAQYNAKPDAKLNTAGEALSIEFH